MTSRAKPTVLAGALMLLILADGVSAQTQLQTIAMAEPGWYFVSLQVQPLDDDPLSVFPVIGGFAYDHLWSYDPGEGWQHFSPAFAADVALQSFNDLTAIEVLRGYWIRVTAVPSPNFELSIEGDSVRVQRLTGPGWHAIGPLVPHDSPPSNLRGVFGDLGPALSEVISEAWGYDGQRGEFTALSPADAACNTSPSACLSPGRGYWIHTTGDLALGKEFEITPPGLVLTADAALRKLEISYTGVGAAAGTLRPTAPGTSIQFTAARFAYIDGFPVAEPDPGGGSPDGPDAEADLDGDGSLEPCPDLCSGAGDCLNLCFKDSSRKHAVYLSLEPEALYALESFTSLDPGQELATLELNLGAGLSPLARAAVSGEGDVVATVPIAVNPPILTGEWAGYLFYGSNSLAQVPIRVWMDDCLQSPGGGPESRDCSGSRVTAVVNPTLTGSSSNGLDDDRDGDVDESDEEGGTFRTREAPGFPSDVVLRGSTAAGNRLLRLEGTAPAGHAFGGAASIACVTNQCADGSGACSIDAECPRNAGIGHLFRQSTRSLQIEGLRSGPQSYVGTFIDRYASVALSGGSGTAATGRIVLRNVSAPQCVARDGGSLRSRPLDLGCRSDSDCPRRCIGGHPSLDGFSCVDDSDCVASLHTGFQVVSSCKPFSCKFSLLGGASAGATDHGPASLSLSTQGSFDIATVEILGSDRVVFVRPADQGAIDVGPLPCGPIDLRISANNCDPVVVEIADACAPLDPVDFTCDDPPLTPTASSPGSTGGQFTLIAGVTTLGPADVQIDNPSASCIGCVARWEDSGGTPIPSVLFASSPPISLFGVGTNDVAAGRLADTPWTDLLSWPPAPEMRSGLLSLLPLLLSPGP